jgi:hypothetical protein
MFESIKPGHASKSHATFHFLQFVPFPESCFKSENRRTRFLVSCISFLVEHGVEWRLSPPPAVFVI